MPKTALKRRILSDEGSYGRFFDNPEMTDIEVSVNYEFFMHIGPGL